MSDRKPWEETWTAHGSAVQADGRDVLDAWYRRDDPVGGDARARLAAAAPDLVRALLAVEWVAVDCESMCVWCGAHAEDRYTRDGWTPIGEHEDDCQRQAALRKAGVIE